MIPTERSLMDRNELLSRLRAATGGDREIDADLSWVLEHARAQAAFNNAATGLPRDYSAALPIPAGMGQVGVRAMAPAYTASVDAALALLERAGGGYRLYTLDASIVGRVSVMLKGPDRLWPADAESEAVIAPGWETGAAATLPLALCIAILALPPKAEGDSHGR